MNPIATSKQKKKTYLYSSSFFWSPQSYYHSPFKTKNNSLVKKPKHTNLFYLFLLSFFFLFCCLVWNVGFPSFFFMVYYRYPSRHHLSYIKKKNPCLCLDLFAFFLFRKILLRIVLAALRV